MNHNYKHPDVSIPAKDIDSKEAVEAVVKDSTVEIYWNNYVTNATQPDMVVPQGMVIIEP